jgi:hypothetical protein
MTMKLQRADTGGVSLSLLKKYVDGILFAQNLLVQIKVTAAFPWTPALSMIRSGAIDGYESYSLLEGCGNDGRIIDVEGYTVPTGTLVTGRFDSENAAFGMPVPTSGKTVVGTLAPNDYLSFSFSYMATHRWWMRMTAGTCELSCITNPVDPDYGAWPGMCPTPMVSMVLMQCWGLGRLIGLNLPSYPLP